MGEFSRRWLRKAWRCSGSGALNQAGGQINVRSRGAAGLGKKCSEETQKMAGAQARWPETEEKLAVRDASGSGGWLIFTVFVELTLAGLCWLYMVDAAVGVFFGQGAGGKAAWPDSAVGSLNAEGGPSQMQRRRGSVLLSGETRWAICRS